MSTFAIKSHQYTITLYTPGHQQISWGCTCKKKSADILSFGISFITISRYLAACTNPKWPNWVDISIFGSQSTLYSYILHFVLPWHEVSRSCRLIRSYLPTVYLLTYQLTSSQPLIVLGIGRKISQGEHVVHSSHISSQP